MIKYEKITDPDDMHSYDVHGTEYRVLLDGTAIGHVWRGDGAPGYWNAWRADGRIYDSSRRGAAAQLAAQTQETDR